MANQGKKNSSEEKSSEKIILRTSAGNSLEMYSAIVRLSGNPDPKAGGVITQPHVFSGFTCYKIAFNQNALKDYVVAYERARTDLQTRFMDKKSGDIDPERFAEYQKEYRSLYDGEISVELFTLKYDELQIQESLEKGGNDIPASAIAALFDIIIM